jgi:uncharacterized UBP type Zn finger protein
MGIGACEHLTAAGAATEPQPSTTEGCSGCLAAGRKDWVHLRLCLECGYVGCCDSSPATHATKHYEETHHPVMRSFEPGEDWKWCYLDETIG